VVIGRGSRLRIGVRISYIDEFITPRGDVPGCFHIVGVCISFEPLPDVSRSASTFAIA
jgi:hypothetical protein